MTINRFKKTTVSVLVALSLGATGAIANDQISKPAGAKGTGTAKAFFKRKIINFGGLISSISLR